MSATLVEFAEKFDILQSAIMHVCAERRNANVEDVPDKEYRHAEDICYCNQVCREQSQNNRTYLIDNKRNDASRKPQTEQTRIGKNVREYVYAVVKFSETREEGCDLFHAFFAPRVAHNKQECAACHKAYARPFKCGDLFEEQKRERKHKDTRKNQIPSSDLEKCVEGTFFANEVDCVHQHTKPNMHKTERKGYAEQNQRPVAVKRFDKLKFFKERARYVKTEPTAEYRAPYDCGYTAHADDEQQSALARNGFLIA